LKGQISLKENDESRLTRTVLEASAVAWTGNGPDEQRPALHPRIFIQVCKV
jgi:hypothetical protein